ncbi:hypothetical protein PFNF54_05867 [Plasmodium falciparum NF54]|nr:hypothetical protein PFNF54_05867 [Plasmodium falciparum NF54]
MEKNKKKKSLKGKVRNKEDVKNDKNILKKDKNNKDSSHGTIINTSDKDKDESKTKVLREDNIFKNTDNSATFYDKTSDVINVLYDYKNSNLKSSQNKDKDIISSNHEDIINNTLSISNKLKNDDIFEKSMLLVNNKLECEDTITLLEKDINVNMNDYDNSSEIIKYMENFKEKKKCMDNVTFSMGYKKEDNKEEGKEKEPHELKMKIEEKETISYKSKKKKKMEK